jgi:HlyD family secretion protein
VIEDDGGASVARERPITIGHRNGLWAQVLEGLEPGERVVAYPSDRVTPGTRVVPR